MNTMVIFYGFESTIPHDWKKWSPNYLV